MRGASAGSLVPLVVDPVIAVAAVDSKQRDKGAGNDENDGHCDESESFHDASFLILLPSK
jgi:hypothetical protein